MPQLKFLIVSFLFYSYLQAQDSDKQSSLKDIKRPLHSTFISKKKDHLEGSTSNFSATMSLSQAKAQSHCHDKAITSIKNRSLLPIEQNEEFKESQYKQIFKNLTAFYQKQISNLDIPIAFKDKITHNVFTINAEDIRCNVAVIIQKKLDEFKANLQKFMHGFQPSYEPLLLISVGEIEDRSEEDDVSLCSSQPLYNRQSESFNTTDSNGNHTVAHVHSADTPEGRVDFLVVTESEQYDTMQRPSNIHVEIVYTPNESQGNFSSHDNQSNQQGESKQDTSPRSDEPRHSNDNDHAKDAAMSRDFDNQTERQSQHNTSAPSRQNQHQNQSQSQSNQNSKNNSQSDRSQGDSKQQGSKGNSQSNGSQGKSNQQDSTNNGPLDGSQGGSQQQDSKSNSRSGKGKTKNGRPSSPDGHNPSPYEESNYPSYTRHESDIECGVGIALNLFSTLRNLQEIQRADERRMARERDDKLLVAHGYQYQVSDNLAEQREKKIDELNKAIAKNNSPLSMSDYWLTNKKYESRERYLEAEKNLNNVNAAIVEEQYNWRGQSLQEIADKEIADKIKEEEDKIKAEQEIADQLKRQVESLVAYGYKFQLSDKKNQELEEAQAEIIKAQNRSTLEYWYTNKYANEQRWQTKLKNLEAAVVKEEAAWKTQALEEIAEKERSKQAVQEQEAKEVADQKEQAEKATREQEAQEVADPREQVEQQAPQDPHVKEATDHEQAPQEQNSKEAARQKEEAEQAARAQNAKEIAEKEQAEKAIQQQHEKELADQKEEAEQADREQRAKEIADQKEQSEQTTQPQHINEADQQKDEAERAIQAQHAKEVADKKEEAERAARQKEQVEKADREQQAKEAARQKEQAEQAAREQQAKAVARQQEEVEQAARQKAQADVENLLKNYTDAIETHRQNKTGSEESARNPYFDRLEKRAQALTESKDQLDKSKCIHQTYDMSAQARGFMMANNMNYAAFDGAAVTNFQHCLTQEIVKIIESSADMNYRNGPTSIVGQLALANCDLAISAQQLNQLVQVNEAVALTDLSHFFETYGKSLLDDDGSAEAQAIKNVALGIYDGTAQALQQWYQFGQDLCVQPKETIGKQVQNLQAVGEGMLKIAIAINEASPLAYLDDMTINFKNSLNLRPKNDTDVVADHKPDNSMWQRTERNAQSLQNGVSGALQSAQKVVENMMQKSVRENTADVTELAVNYIIAGKVTDCLLRSSQLVGNQILQAADDINKNIPPHLLDSTPNFAQTSSGGLIVVADTTGENIGAAIAAAGNAIPDGLHNAIKTAAKGNQLAGKGNNGGKGGNDGKDKPKAKPADSYTYEHGKTHPSNKHNKNSRDGVGKPPRDAQDALDKSFPVEGSKERVIVQDGKIVVLKQTGDELYHAYIVEDFFSIENTKTQHALVGNGLVRSMKSGAVVK